MSKNSGDTRPRTRSAPGAARPSTAPPSGRASIPWLLVGGVVAAVIIVGGTAFVAGSRNPAGGGGPTAAGDEFGHIHGLSIDPASRTVYAATHHGLFRVAGEHSVVRVSTQAPDLMGFAVVGPGHFLASGHPGTGDGGPADLGLVESTDGGVTWRTLSLPGAADFHGLRAAHGAVYGYSARDATFMVSTDRRTWQRRATVPMGAFAVSPTEADTILAVGRDGLMRSTDGGRTWLQVGDAPQFTVLTWDQSPEIWGGDLAGIVWRSTDGGTKWSRRGALPAPPEALATHGGTVYAAVDGARILASTDGGATWQVTYSPG
ncbi:MAG: glycosyl hydrolase [Actinobacteria bacterium]|nr:glycosyl hydrolase [Actinomycetota bacterium]MBI3686341.1 glycosyl hydrolase [Actinomycetota bacterium]